MGCDCSKYDDEDNITFVNIAVEEPSPVILEGVKIFQEGDIRIGNYIAEGGNGKVHIGVDKRTKKSYALKFFGYTDIIPSLDAIEREIYLMKQLSGISGVVELVGVMMDSETGLLPKRMSLAPLPVIIMELLQGGELYDHVAKGKVFCEENMAKIITALVGTVLCIHDRNFIHRDLKLENIMFLKPDDDSTLKLVDLGCVIKLKEGSRVYRGHKAVGSPGYVAPESLIKYEYSHATDAWQIGVILYMMLSGRFPFDPNHNEQIMEGTYYPMTGVGWDTISNEAKDLVSKLLVKDPSKRMPVKNILKHPWFASANSSPSCHHDMGGDYFARLKHLVLCQKLKRFFKDHSNIQHDSAIRRDALLESFNWQVSDLESKLKIFKDTAVAFLMRQASASIDSTSSPYDKLDYATYKILLDKANLSEFGSETVFSVFDTGHTGLVDIKDILLTLIAFNLDEDSPESSEEATSAVEERCALYFRLFDIDNTGFIDENNLKLLTPIVIKDQGILCDQSIDELFQVIDRNNDGQICFKDFKKFYSALLARSTLSH